MMNAPLLRGFFMEKHMKISDQGLELIKRYEGLRTEAYKCPAGVWTIGYGHTHQVKQGDSIDTNIAHEYLKKDVRHAQNTINKYVTTNLEQHQFNALVSFTFNIGSGNFIKSTLLRMLNKTNYSGAENQFKRWNKARVNGALKPLRGLTRRRADEAEMFGNHEHNNMAQIIEAPKLKTKISSKTNITAIGGGVGLLISQYETISAALDNLKTIGNKGGDLADKIGTIFSSNNVSLIAVLSVIAMLGYIIFERNKKIDQHGL